jgi:hypothetical protein
VNEHQARELRGVLSRRFPTGEVEVIPEKGGAKIVVQAKGESHDFSVGDGPSALLNLLLAGFAD